MLALAATIARAQIELKWSRGDEAKDHLVSVHGDLDTWLDSEIIRPHLSNQERALLALDPGSWPQEDLLGVLSQTEGLVALLWALERLDPMPSYVSLTNATDVFAHLPLRQPCRPLLRALTYRPIAEIADGRDTAEFWNWRARTEQQHRDGQEPPPGETYVAAVRGATEFAHCHGLVGQICDGDVLVGDKPYTAIDQDLLDSLATVAYERHYAFNWLCGDEMIYDWDKVPTPT